MSYDLTMKLIYPTWRKLRHQTTFHLPPHGPVVFAAAVPDEVDLTFVDENVQPLDTDDAPDLVALSVMLTCQLPRAIEIADAYRARGVKVIMGGIAIMLHADEAAAHADSVFLGEAEGRFAAVLDDLQRGRLKARYDYMRDFPPIASVGPARRSILDRDKYNYRGVQMLDLVHASRGCRFNCFPCCNGYLGGSEFRPRPVEQFLAELETIPNNRLFIVDNSLAQDRDWLIELFKGLIPLKRKWVSHPILYDEEIIALAAEAGCWYVYQAVFDTSDVIRSRIQMLKDHGIGIEGTVILGTDDQSPDDVKRLVEFLCEMEMDIAEFTIMTPFPHSPICRQFEDEGRILSRDWSRYTCDEVVFKPAKMTPDELYALYDYAWETFYADSGYQLKMGELFRKLMVREIADGTYRRFDPQGGKRFKPAGTAGGDAE